MKKSGGFTLIEVLIVMVIISIVASVAVLTITHNQTKRLAYLANQLVNIILLSEEEAILRPATLGVAFMPHHFQVFEYREKKWTSLKNANFGLHAFSSDIQITLHVQNKIQALDGKPHLIISESGDLTPFVILIGNKEESPRYQVIGESSGNVKSEAIDEK